MSKKLLLCAVVLLLAASVVFAGGARQSAAGGKTTVQFWYAQSGSTGQLIQDCANAFNASQSDIEVVATFAGSYWDAVAKIQNAVGAGGDLPDCFQMGTGQVSAFSSEEGILADLLPLMKKTNMDPNDFIDAFIWDYYINNKLIALPFGRSTPVLYMNRDMMDAQGLKTPTNWDELKQVSNALVTREGNEIVRNGMITPYDTWYFVMFLGQAGGKLLNDSKTALGCIDDGTAFEAWSYMQDLQRSGGLYYVPNGTDSSGLFLAEKSGMLMTSVGSMNGIFDNAKFKVEVAFCPRGKNQVVVTGGNSLCMLESSKVKDAAWTFINWLYTDPNGLVNYVLGTGYIPPKNTMVQLPAVQQAWRENPFKKLAFDQLQYGSDKHWMYPGFDGNAILSEIGVFADAILFDFRDVRQQLDVLNRSVQQILRR